MKEAAVKRGFTASEYLQTERQEQGKNEYFKGVIFSMFASDRNHTLINKNLSALLKPVLSDQSCTGYENDMRLHIPQKRLYTYSDFMVVCGAPELMPGVEADNLLNPILIVEIISPCTKFYDQGRKFQLYQAILTLRQYIMIDSTIPFQVETFSLMDEAVWESKTLNGAETLLHFDSINYSLPLREIYSETTF